MVLKKTLEKITKNYLNELQNPPVNNKDTNEDINKVVKLPWIHNIGPKLRQCLETKTLPPFLHQVQIENCYYTETRQSCYLAVILEYMN